MTHHGEIRGGVPVAAIDSLPEAERVVVQALRHWAGGPAGAARIAEMLGERMPPGAAAECQRALGDMFAIIGRFGRRKRQGGGIPGRSPGPIYHGLPVHMPCKRQK